VEYDSRTIGIGTYCMYRLPNTLMYVEENNTDKNQGRYTMNNIFNY